MTFNNMNTHGWNTRGWKTLSGMACALAGLVTIASSQTAMAQAGAQGLTAKDFAMTRSTGLVELGPKGQSLAFLSRNYSLICRNSQLERQPVESCGEDDRHLAPNDNIIIIDIEKMAQHRVIPVPADNTINWMEWTSEDNLLISLTTPWKYAGRSSGSSTGTRRRNRTYVPPTSRILSVDRDASADAVVLFGGEARMLRNNVHLSHVVDLLHDDPNHVIMGARRRSDYDLFRVNVNDGEATRVAKGKDLTFAWYTDHENKPSIRLDCTTRKCRALDAYRPAEGADPNDEGTDWVKFRRIELRKRGLEDVREIEWVAPTGKPDEFYVEVEGEGEERRSIKTYNVKSGTFTGEVFSDPDFDVRGAIINPETGEYAGAYLWRDRLEYHLTDKQLGRHLKAINAFFADSWNISMTGFSNNGKLAVVMATAPNDPGGYYLYDFETHSVSKLFGLYEHMPPELQAKTDVISLPMRDGTNITGYHTQPMTANVNPPLIVLVHGGPESRDLYDYDRTTAFLASRGYQVLRLNFRGSSGYGREFAEAGYRQWDGVMHTDVIDATQHMQSQGLATPERTCIMGYSYGGYAALLAGARAADKYACVISGAGPTDLYESLKDDRKDHGNDSAEFEYWTKSIGDMDADRNALALASLAGLAGKFDDPVLLLHGEEDDIVKVDHSDDMFDALDKAGKSVTYVKFEDEGHFHDEWSIETSERYFQAIEDFLATALPR